MKLNNKNLVFENINIIGLTGGIGSGKTTVSNLIEIIGEENGISVYILDGDKLSREIFSPFSEALNEVETVFGKEVISDDGSMNRKKLGQIVFSNKAELQKLNYISEKYMDIFIERRISEAKKSQKYRLIVIDGAIIFELNVDKKCDIVCGVYSDNEVREERIMIRNGFSREEANLRINSQISNEELMLKCDIVIENSSSLKELNQEIINFINLF